MDRKRVLFIYLLRHDLLYLKLMTTPLSLPISMNVSPHLNVQFVKLTSILSKLEAQFNFRTMTAGWYGDEEAIHTFSIHILTPSEYSVEYKTHVVDQLTSHADDAFSCFNGAQNGTHCFLSITENEQILFSEHPAIISKLIEKKVEKLLNSLSSQYSLSTI